MCHWSLAFQYSFFYEIDHEVTQSSAHGVADQILYVARVATLIGLSCQYSHICLNGMRLR